MRQSRPEKNQRDHGLQVSRRPNIHRYRRLLGEVLEPRMMLASVSEPTSVIVPSRHATREGDGMNAIPFAPTSNRRYQQIYSASEFAQGGAIDAVRFRRDRNHEPFEATTLDVQISLSHAATTVATASEVFSENIGTGNVVVYSGPLSLSSSGSGTPNPFDVVIDVANVFEYDPEVGDLLLDIRVLGGSLSHGALDASIIPPTTIRIFGTINATVGSTGINGDRTPYGLVTQFDLVPPTASVDGRTFNDLDGDGVFEPTAGEAPIAGRTVYLDLNGNGRLDSPQEPSQITGGDGVYRFEGLAPGDYTVGQAPAVDFEQSFPSQPQPSVRLVSVATNDLVFDPISGKIYASTTSGAGDLANRIVAIDPATGTIVNSVALGGTGGKLAVSDNGQYLYVAMGSAVQRVNLPTLTLGQQFSIAPLQVDDMAVMPGHANTVAISRFTPGQSPRTAQIGIYDDGVVRPRTAGGGNEMEFDTSGTVVYGYLSEISSYQFNRMVVTPDGLVGTHAIDIDLIYGPANIEYEAGRLYVTNGGVLDPEALSKVGAYAVGGSLEPATSRGLTFFLSGNTLRAFDQQTFLPVGSLTVPGVGETHSGLIEWGTEGLAFRTTADQVAVVEWNPRPATHQVEFTPGQTASGLDFGNRATAAPGSISGKVYHDQDESGTQDANEPGLAGWTLFLDQNGNGQPDAGERTTFTDAAGNYHFAEVPPGNYVVTQAPRANFKPITPEPLKGRVRQIDLIANDIVYSPFTQKVYASVGSTTEVIGNSIVVIDPVSGSIVSNVFVGSEPNKLAISDDGKVLYVALNGANAVRRVDLTTLTAGLQFSVNPLLVQDMEVLPGQPNAVAVTRFDPRFSPSGAGVVIYDDGVPRPGAAASREITISSSPSILYGFDNEFGNRTFYRLIADSSGVRATHAVDFLFDGDLEYADGRLYVTSGQVINPETRTVLGTMGFGFVEPDLARGLTFFVNGPLLTAFNQQTFEQVGSFTLPGVAHSFGLIRWGTNGLALRGESGQVVLAEWEPSNELQTRAYPVVIKSGEIITDRDFGSFDMNLANDPPRAVNDAAQVGENNVKDAAAAEGVLANDTDDNAGDTKTVTSVNGIAENVGQEVTLASGARVKVLADGSYRYDPNGKFEGLGEGQTATDSFTYEVADELGAKAVATVTITIVGANDAPVAGNDEFATLEDAARVITRAEYLANDSDVDSNVLMGMPLTQPGHGSVSLRPDGGFDYVPVGNYSGPDSFTYQISDGLATSNVATIALTVTAVNDAPVVSLSGDVTVMEGTVFAAVGSFADDDVGDSWTASVDYGDRNGAQPLALNGNKTFQLGRAYPDDGTYTVTVVVRDATDRSASASFQVIVHNVAPQILSWNGPAQPVRGRSLAFGGTFRDAGADDTHTATIDWGDGQTSAAAVARAGDVWQVSASHAYATGGAYQAALHIRDDDGEVATQTTTVIIAGVRLHAGVLEIIGTSARDHLRLQLVNKTLVVRGALGKASIVQAFPYSGMQRIVAQFGHGNDSLTVDSKVKLPLVAVGGAGNDTFRAGGGPAVLIGGEGQDKLTGGVKSDLLIAGSTVYDDNQPALSAILAEWTSTRSLIDRSQNLRTGSGPILDSQSIALKHNETIFDDVGVDTLFGGGDLDWFLFDAKKDKPKDKRELLN